jgi:acyl carrier protein
LTSAYEAPRGVEEEAVIEIWREVLGVDGIGRDDNFFELGGDSLLATQVFARLRQRFPTELQLEDVLMNETPAAVASEIRSALENPRTTRSATIPRVPRDRDLALSAAQQWLWSVDQYMPGSAAYNLPFAARVRGDLRPDVLDAVLTRIAERHEVLRSAYPMTDEGPVQRIATDMPIALPLVDLGDLAGENLMAAAWQRVTEQARRPFDLQNGPLIRGELLRLGPHDHVVAITMHHIVADAWSMGVFARELSALYPALSNGSSAELPELTVQYADYAAWQRQRLDDERTGQLLEYWKGHLAAAPQLLDLVTDRPRPQRPSGRGQRVAFSFKKELTEKLRTLAKTRQATLFMVLLSGFSTLLYRQCGQIQMLIGVPLAGRSRAETEELIGCFINTTVIRTDHSGNPRFETFVEQVRDTTLSAYAHQDIPFERVVNAVQAQRTLHHNPLVQVLFDFQNIPPRPPFQIPGLDIEPMGAELATAKLDLVVDMWEREDGLAGSVEFSTDLFDPRTIERLMAQFETLLTDAAERPHARLLALETSSEGEKQQAQMSREQDRVMRKQRFAEFAPKAAHLPGVES